MRSDRVCRSTNSHRGGKEWHVDLVFVGLELPLTRQPEGPDNNQLGSGVNDVTPDAV